MFHKGCVCVQNLSPWGDKENDESDGLVILGGRG